jgi:chromosome segregation ATPase
MATYDIEQFSKRIGLSSRSIRRYIKQGKTKFGNEWQPKKVKGKYVFSDTDLALWQTDKSESIDTDKPKAANISIDVNEIFTEMKGIATELAESRGHSLALKAQSESLSNDYEKIKEKYIEAMARIKQLEIENSQLKEQIKDLKNRNLIDVLFRKK